MKADCWMCAEEQVEDNLDSRCPYCGDGPYCHTCMQYHLAECEDMPDEEG